MTPQERKIWVRAMGARSEWWDRRREAIIEPELGGRRRPSASVGRARLPRSAGPAHSASDQPLSSRRISSRRRLRPQGFAMRLHRLRIELLYRRAGTPPAGRRDGVCRRSRRTHGRPRSGNPDRCDRRLCRPARSGSRHGARCPRDTRRRAIPWHSPQRRASRGSLGAAARGRGSAGPLRRSGLPPRRRAARRAWPDLRRVSVPLPGRSVHRSRQGRAGNDDDREPPRRADRLHARPRVG